MRFKPKGKNKEKSPGSEPLKMEKGNAEKTVPFITESRGIDKTTQGNVLPYIVSPLAGGIDLRPVDKDPLDKKPT